MNKNLAIIISLIINITDCEILKELKKIYPDTDLHLLEMTILQYLFLDCDENYKPNENNEEYLKAKDLYKQNEFKTVLLNEDLK